MFHPAPLFPSMPLTWHQTPPPESFTLALREFEWLSMHWPVCGWREAPWQMRIVSAVRNTECALRDMQHQSITRKLAEQWVQDMKRDLFLSELPVSHVQMHAWIGHGRSIYLRDAFDQTECAACFGSYESGPFGPHVSEPFGSYESDQGSSM